MKDVILFYGDTHLRETGSFPPFNQIQSNGFTGELNNIIEGFRFIADQILEIKPKAVFNLGDTYNNTEFQSARVLHGSNIALSYIKSACDEIGCEHHIIPGNHDILNENMMITSISNLIGYGNIYLEPYYLNIGDLRIACLPASVIIGKAYARIAEAMLSADLVLCHQDFSGAKYDSGHRSESSLASAWKKPIAAGDIHPAQSFNSINYVGSIVQSKFYKSDLDTVGGIMTFDLGSGKFERVKNMYSKHYVRVRDLDAGLKLNPKEVVCQIISEKSRDEIEEMFKGYEHYYIKAITDRTSDVKVTYDNFALDNPELLLRGHVNKERPEALGEYDNIIGTKQGEECVNA